MNPWLNINQASKYAGVHRDTFRPWLHDGLKHSRIGRLVRIKPEAIDAYIERFEFKEFDIEKAMEGIL